jgi:hypothetical protein
VSKKSIIITVVACVVCSAVSFFVGFSIPRDNQGRADGEASQTAKQDDEDAKYEGLYLAEYYENGKQFTSKIYLNANHDCKSPDAINPASTCEWKIEDGRLITTSVNGGGSLGKTQDECKKQLDEQENARQGYNYYYDGTIGYKIIEADEKHKAQGFVCLVTPITEKKYDILGDGSLSGDKHYYKR